MMKNPRNSRHAEVGQEVRALPVRARSSVV